MANKWDLVKGVRERKLSHVQTLAMDSAKRADDVNQSLEQVKSYISDYKAQLSGDEKQGVSVTSLARTRNFIQKLVGASNEQEKLLSKLKQQAEQDQLKLNQCRADVKAVDKLQEKDREKQKRAAAKKEANLMDELASRRFSSLTNKF